MSRDDYLAQADAVIAHLALTEETRRLEDGSAGAWMDSDGRFHFPTKPGTRQRRYVTPWENTHG